MIQDIFHVILWVTVILLVISGLDDMLIDVMYWFFRKKYRSEMPSFGEMNSKPERSIAVMIGAWREEKVIGRTLTIALKKLRYSNFRIFVAVYPNDLKTVKVVREIARKDSRVILCLNPQDGPTTKADNLNNSFTCIKEYERQFGEFDIILIHDSEDFIHPLSLKLFNYLIMYKGNYAVQIPVIPIKNKLGRLYHRTYCDGFAELHTKDMIVRQSMGSFIPFAGTGMAFNRKAFHYLESQSLETEQRKEKYKKKFGRPIEETAGGEDYIVIKDQEKEEGKYGDMFKEDPYPQYDDIPIPGWDDEEKKKTDEKTTSNVRHYSILLSVVLLLGTAFVMFAATASSDAPFEVKQLPAIKGVSTVNEMQIKHNVNTLPEISEIIADENYSVAYEKYTDGTFKLKESAWDIKENAVDRMLLLSGIPELSGRNIALVSVEEDSKLQYKVVIDKYASADECAIDAGIIRQTIK